MRGRRDAARYRWMQRKGEALRPGGGGTRGSRSRELPEKSGHSEARQDVAHQLALCGVFNRVDPETERFARGWEARAYAQCGTKTHDQYGCLIDERTS
jgi:hypothetical protein